MMQTRVTVLVRQPDVRNNIYAAAKFCTLAVALIVSAAGTISANAAYLNFQNTTVALGESMSAEPFANRTTADSLASIIDLASPTQNEQHTQTSHVWVSGGSLELNFAFDAEYDLHTLHFWNYFTETYDIDDISLQFFNDSGALVGALAVQPVTGTHLGSEFIAPADYVLAFPTNVRFVNALLTGTNGQVDFNNLGFSGELSQVPVPAAFWLLASAFGVLSCTVLMNTPNSRAMRFF
tara:strand:- start:6856 stop:7566 length:711 start_codon:yes stop_codon:yes gene_type:complete